MVLLLARDLKWLCHHSSVTRRCRLYGGFRIYLAGFTSRCGRREHTQLVTAAQPQLLRQYVPHFWVYICALGLP